MSVPVLKVYCLMQNLHCNYSSLVTLLDTLLLEQDTSQWDVSNTCKSNFYDSFNSTFDGLLWPHDWSYKEYWQFKTVSGSFYQLCQLSADHIEYIRWSIMNNFTSAEQMCTFTTEKCWGCLNSAGLCKTCGRKRGSKPTVAWSHLFWTGDPSNS